MTGGVLTALKKTITGFISNCALTKPRCMASRTSPPFHLLARHCGHLLCRHSLGLIDLTTGSHGEHGWQVHDFIIHGDENNDS